MSKKELLINEIEQVPEIFLDEEKHLSKKIGLNQKRMRHGKIYKG